MRKIIWLLVLVFLFSSCQNTLSADESTIHIDLDQKIDPIQASGLIKSYDLIRLQTSEEALIGNIDQIIMHNDLIYIVDFKMQSLFIYHSNGRFVRKINRWGRAGNEYLQMESVFIDEQDNTLNILDRNPSKILKFNVDGSGEPKIIPLGNGDIYLEEILSHNDMYIGYSENTPLLGKSRNIWFLDQTGKMIDSQIDIPAGWESNGFSDVTAFSRYRDHIYFMDIHFNAYRLEKTAFTPCFRLDFGTLNWPEAIRSAQDYRNHRADDFIRNMYRYQESEKYWIFHYIYEGQNVLSLYDKQTKKSSTWSTSESNRETFYIPFGVIRFLDKERMVTSVDASRVTRLLTDEEIAPDLAREYPEPIQRLRDKVGNLKADDNPVLVIYEIN